MRIALAQVASKGDWRANLRTVETLIRKAAGRKASAVLFPENVLYRGPTTRFREVATELHREDVLQKICALARSHRIAVLLGSYPELRRGSRKVFNTSVWIGERGDELARYRKIHLFDALLPSGKRYRESAFFLPGKRLVTFRWRGITIGMTVCYDVRFPEQFRSLARKGAEWIVVPSAFTRETGHAHWDTLLRARAIENLAFVLAPAQTGKDTFGHSRVFGPWGELLAGADRNKTLLFAEIGAEESRQLRRRFSVLKK